MDIKDMRAFYAIVEEGNISHAAGRLAVAQPALSRQMKRLESALGVKLFERGSRRIRLTEAGRVLKERVEQILGLVDGTVREIQDVGEGTAGEVRIGTITSSGANLVPGLLAAFHETHPRVTFQIFEAEGARVLDMLDNRLIEIAVTRTEVERENYESIVLANEPLGDDEPHGVLRCGRRFRAARRACRAVDHHPASLAGHLSYCLPQGRFRAAHPVPERQHRTGCSGSEGGTRRGDLTAVGEEPSDG